MLFLVYLAASAFGATTFVGTVWRDKKGHALGIAAVTFAAGVATWAAILRRFGLGRFLPAAAVLCAAIILPGLIGALVAGSHTSRARLVAGLLAALCFWLAFAYFGLFPICDLDPRCDM